MTQSRDNKKERDEFNHKNQYFFLIISVIFLPKTLNLNFNHEESLDKPKLSDALRNNWLIMF